MTAEKIAELKRLWAAETPGEWVGELHDLHDGFIDDKGYVRLETPVSEMVGYAKVQDVVFAAEIYNAFPSLIAALEAAQAERDAAKAEVARQWLTLTEIAEEVENFADCDDSEEGIANRPNLAMRVQMMADKATQCNPQAYAWLAEKLANATDAEAGHWINIIRRLDPENLCDVFDGLGVEENLRQWLAARDARMKAEGAAEWLECHRNDDWLAVDQRERFDREAAELRRKGING